MIKSFLTENENEVQNLINSFASITNFILEFEDDLESLLNQFEKSAYLENIRVSLILLSFFKMINSLSYL